MTRPERPLRLDAPREEALEHAAGWWPRPGAASTGSGPRSRRSTSASGGSSRRGCPTSPTPVHEALDDAARILDESIAQPRPRYFAFIGSSGLEIGAIGDLLAHTYDINLAVDARAATQVEHQAVRWVGGVHRVPGRGRRVHERRHDQQRDARSRRRASARCRDRGTRGSAAGASAVYCSQEVHYSVTRAVELLGHRLGQPPGDRRSTGCAGCGPTRWPTAIDADVGRRA